MFREELKFVLLCRGIVTRYQRRQVFLGTDRGVPVEQTAVDDVSAARFEKISGVDVVDF